VAVRQVVSDDDIALLRWTQENENIFVSATFLWIKRVVLNLIPWKVSKIDTTLSSAQDMIRRLVGCSSLASIYKN